MLWCVVQIANDVVNKLLGMCVGTCVNLSYCVLEGE